MGVYTKVHVLVALHCMTVKHLSIKTTVWTVRCRSRQKGLCCDVQMQRGVILKCCGIDVSSHGLGHLFGASLICLSSHLHTAHDVLVRPSASWAESVN